MLPRISRRCLTLVSAMALCGCANFTAVSSTNRPDIQGVRVYAPKTILVVNGTEVKSVIVPDCTREYALQFNSILAKHDVSIELADGMLKKVDSKQDTTALPLKLVDAVIDATKAGKSLGTAFSEKAPEATSTNRFGVFELNCVDGKLVASPAVNPAVLYAVETRAATAPRPGVPADPASRPDESRPIPK